MDLQNDMLTSFLDLLPAELMPPDHWEDWIEAMLNDHLQGFLQMERMETWRSSLNITHHIHLCKTKQDMCVNQLLLLLSTFMYSAVPRYLLSLHPAVVGVPGCNLTNSWIVSKEVDESLETSGLLRCTLAPQAIATFSISVWSVDTHMLEKQNCTVVIVFCNSVLLVTWLFLWHICRYYTWVCQWQNEALNKRGKKTLRVCRPPPSS